MLFWRSSEGGHNPSSDCCSWVVWVDDPVHFWSLGALKQRFFFLMVCRGSLILLCRRKGRDSLYLLTSRGCVSFFCIELSERT